jgi:hypothetical protein
MVARLSNDRPIIDVTNSAPLLYHTLRYVFALVVNKRDETTDRKGAHRYPSEVETFVVQNPFNMDRNLFPKLHRP